MRAAKKWKEKSEKKNPSKDYDYQDTFKLKAWLSGKWHDLFLAGRVQWMCEKFDIPVPDWAKNAKATPSSLSVVRNDTFHEALFFDRPLGFSIYGGNQSAPDQINTILQMQALVCRLLVAILGQPGSSYIKTPVDTRQRHALELRG
ncbi:MAG: hypothetical protein Q8L45_15420 [Xanthomonadaceae bacterium]|nr:hypothetical protein [Xanthomonadaceae bacterium]MDP2186421.1 hypothetical protein [Xanthomonadales bacterium]MDZ4115467.1 hypothetical protein [Xanthomonadaceae bacterium]MDZ4376952.1 hypothetical protein [Xanthomonadaceae bacterium]